MNNNEITKVFSEASEEAQDAVLIVLKLISQGMPKAEIRQALIDNGIGGKALEGFDIYFMKNEAIA